MIYQDQETFIIALLSVFFYSLLCFVSLRYYLKFHHLQHDSSNKAARLYYRTNLSHFDETKSQFFLILFLSALCDIPNYLLCLFSGSPSGCVWKNDFSFFVSYFFHLLAIGGYAYTIILPCILWNDIVNKKDGKLFFSKFPSNRIKQYFQVLFFLYIINSSLNVIVIIINLIIASTDKSSDNDPDEIIQKNFVYNLCNFCEIFLIFFITVGCFYTGLSLLFYVLKAKLDYKIIKKIFLHLNITIFIIVTCYATRGIMMFKIISFIDSGFKDKLNFSYTVWILGTRWLPYIFCSFCLVSMMRTAGADIGKEKGVDPQAKKINHQKETQTAAALAAANSVLLSKNHGSILDLNDQTMNYLHQNHHIQNNHSHFKNSNLEAVSDYFYLENDDNDMSSDFLFTNNNNNDRLSFGLSFSFNHPNTNSNSNSNLHTSLINKSSIKRDSLGKRDSHGKRESLGKRDSLTNLSSTRNSSISRASSSSRPSSTNKPSFFFGKNDEYYNEQEKEQSKFFSFSSNVDIENMNTPLNPNDDSLSMDSLSDYEREKERIDWETMSDRNSEVSYSIEYILATAASYNNLEYENN